MKTFYARYFVIGLVLLALISVGFGPGMAFGATVRVEPQAPTLTLILNPKQDTFVEEYAPTNVHPTDSLVYVGRVSGQKGDMDIQALLQFDLSDLPAGAKITNATLEIYQIETAGEKSFNIWPDVALKPWDETTANWDNRPSMQSVDPEVGVDLIEGWKQFSVFNAVSDWVDGVRTNEGFVLRGDSRTLGIHGFYASATNNPPTLTIEYTVASTCQVLQSSTQIPSPALINFDDLNNARPSRTAIKPATGCVLRIAPPIWPSSMATSRPRPTHRPMWLRTVLFSPTPASMCP